MGWIRHLLRSAELRRRARAQPYGRPLPPSEAPRSPNGRPTHLRQVASLCPLAGVDAWDERGRPAFAPPRLDPLQRCNRRPAFRLEGKGVVHGDRGVPERHVDVNHRVTIRKVELHVCAQLRKRDRVCETCDNVARRMMR